MSDFLSLAGFKPQFPKAAKAAMVTGLVFAIVAVALLIGILIVYGCRRLADFAKRINVLGQIEKNNEQIKKNLSVANADLSVAEAALNKAKDEMKKLNNMNTALSGSVNDFSQAITLVQNRVTGMQDSVKTHKANIEARGRISDLRRKQAYQEHQKLLEEEARLSKGVKKDEKRQKKPKWFGRRVQADGEDMTDGVPTYAGIPSGNSYVPQVLSPELRPMASLPKSLNVSEDSTIYEEMETTHEQYVEIINGLAPEEQTALKMLAVQKTDARDSDFHACEDFSELLVLVYRQEYEGDQRPAFDMPRLNLTKSISAGDLRKLTKHDIHYCSDPDVSTLRVTQELVTPSTLTPSSSTASVNTLVPEGDKVEEPVIYAVPRPVATEAPPTPPVRKKKSLLKRAGAGLKNLVGLGKEEKLTRDSDPYLGRMAADKIPLYVELPSPVGRDTTRFNDKEIEQAFNPALATIDEDHIYDVPRSLVDSPSLPPKSSTIDPITRTVRPTNRLTDSGMAYNIVTGETKVLSQIKDENYKESHL